MCACSYITYHDRSYRPLYFGVLLQVPLSWYNLWEGPDDPTLYLRSLVAKALALGAWKEKARAGTLLQEGALDPVRAFPSQHFSGCPQAADCTVGRVVPH